MKAFFYLFLFFLFLTPLASAQTVSVGDYSTVVDSHIAVPINISDAESIAGGVVNISFDPSIVSIEEVTAGDFGTPVPNINNRNGWVKIVAARIDAVNKNQAVLANIVFNGSSNGTSALTIEYASLNNETGALIVPLISNGKIIVSLSLDDTLPPSSIHDLVSDSGSSWINWTWTNPSDSDFNHTMVYLDGKFVDNTSDQYFNATDLIQGTIHTISTHTVDINGNINETWVNDTAMTTGILSGGLHVTLNRPVNYSIYSVGEQVGFDVNVTDSDNNTISSGISAYVELSGPNNISKHIILSEESGHFVGVYTVDNNDTRGLWLGNITVYNSTSSGQTSFKVYFTGAYFIKPYSDSQSYLLGDFANFTAKVMKPGNPAQYLSDENVSLNLSIYPYNSSTPVFESVEMIYDNNSHLFSTDLSTDLIGPGLFTVLFIGNDTSGNIEVTSLLIGVSEDYAIEVSTEKTDYDRDNPVNISGTVKYLNNSPLSNINVNLLLDLHGFKRSYVVNTNEIGEFNYTFYPFDTEAGNYTIKATATNMGLLRNAESNFTIHGLYIVPQSAIVELVENSSRTLSFTLHNLGDTTLTGISTSVNDLNISDNVIATIDPLSVPSELQPYESASFNLQIEAGTPVPDEAVFQIEVTTDQMSDEISELDVKLFSPIPILKVYPEDVLVGLNKNQTSIRTVGIYNMGYGILRNVTLHQPENTWMRVTSNTSVGDLLPGDNATFDIHINSYNVDLGVYFDSVNITSDNFNEVQVNLTAFVTDLQNGRLLFHVTDALERNLSNANISLINQDTYEEFDGATNSTGYALMNNLPVGRYIFVVSSDGTNTLPQMGNVEVEAMDTPKLMEISLYMSFIDFDWEVTPTSIEDYYNVILRMRFETDIPIPLLLAFPPSIDYNMIPGEEKFGSFKVYNVGLVSIYNVSISSINYNGIILDPLVTNVNEIKGKSSIEVPYKISLSSNAANCQRLSGKINIQGRYVHFINNREVISYAKTSIPVTVKTPVDGSCIPYSPDWPDIKFCVNIDGLHIGDYTEDLKVDPNIIWLRTGPGWGDQKPPVLENVAIAKNNNTLSNIQLSNAMGITLSLGVNEFVSYFTVGTLTPQIPLGVDVVDVIAQQYGINIPFFDGIWKGTFDPNLISPQQSANLNMEKLDTGVGLTLPKILGGGIIFNFGDEECYNCVWVIPIAGYDLTLPAVGLPEIEIYIPHVNLPGGGSSLGGGGSVGGGDFCWNCVPDVFIAPSRPHFGGITYVPWDWPEWNWPDFSSDPIHRRPPPKVTETIHEVIELSISQNVTMERDAFWAGLGIYNKLPDKNIDNVGVSLHIRDDTGSANDRFFIKSPNLRNINNVDGSGVISPSGLATAQWLIIPKPGAGGINPEGAKYNISANITYSVDGINFETVTHEIEIVVKPQPEMVLDYFIPSDVIANKPFKLAVKVTNEGYGEARDFAIETAQPVIYYNPSGLLLDFEIIRSQLQGEERSTSMKVDFGDIQPGESKIAWWDMVTSIDGTFTEFTGDYTHSSELGGMETSLIKEINTYIIQMQMGSGELGYDFLANSESDESYYLLFNSSNGNSTFVNNAGYTVVNMPTPDNPVLDVSIEDYTGEWVIVSLDDPYYNKVPLQKVIRTKDGTEIPSYNYWMRNGRILIVDHYDEGFDGNYTIQYKYSNLVPVITTNRTMFDGRIVVEENKGINFSASDSYDEFGSIVSYKWELGDGTVKEGENIEHTYSRMGEYDVSLTITNNAGISSQASVKVYVVKEIIKFYIIPTNFQDVNLDEITDTQIRNLFGKVQSYYIESSYNSIFIDYSIEPPITIGNRNDYGNEINGDTVILHVINAKYNSLEQARGENNIIILNINEDFRAMASTTSIINDPPATPNIVVDKNDGFSTWAHEIGHTLGYLIEDSKTYDESYLPDLYDSGKNIWWWGLMGRGIDVEPPTHLSSFSKLILNWLKPHSVSFGEYPLKPLEKSKYGDKVFIFISGDLNYIIEARDLPQNHINKAAIITDGTLENGVVIYKVENLDLLSGYKINDNWKINPIPRRGKFISVPPGVISVPWPGTDVIFLDDPTFLAEDGTSALPYIDLFRFVMFSISSASDSPYYQPTIKIETPTEYASNKIGSAINNIKIDIPNIKNLYQAPVNSTLFPDIDLHAYTQNGLHVGTNYSTNIYEIQIPGAIASGDLSNGEEWIFVPKDTNVTFYVSSSDVQKFLEENLDINASNVSIEYSATFMEYGLNPKIVQLPDGNWTVQNRTVSDAQIDTIEPGEMKEIILKDNTPPDTVTSLSPVNGHTWLNFTWANPPDPDFNHTELYLNGTFLTNIPASQNYYNITGLLPDTSYELSTHTVDTSGNINETWVNATARTLPLPDTTPPTITFTPPTDPGDTTLTTRNWNFINVSLSEPGFSWLEWNGTNESMSGSGTHWYINKTGLDNGVYTYRVWANDSAGNVNVSETRAIEIDYDTLPPIITITSPVNDTTYNTDSVDLNYSVNEPTTWQGYSLDGSANITLNGNTTLNGINDGLHTLAVYANDTSGNMNSSTVWFTIDTTPPASISDLQHMAGQTWLNWTWTNPPDPDFNHTEIYLNNIFRLLTSAEFFNATHLAPGTEYTISTRTVDISGNLNSTWQNNTAVTLAGDTELPVIESVSLDAYATIANATIQVTVNATDNVGVDSVTADGVSLTQDENNWTGSFKVPLNATPGTYSVAIQASDAAGNSAESTAIYTVVTPQGGVGIDLIPTDITVDSGTSVTIIVKVTNTENFDDTFNVELTYDNIPAEYSDYKLDFNWTDWSDHRQVVSIKAKSSTEIPLTITVPAGEAGYKLYSITANSLNWVTVGSNTGGILVNTPTGDTTSPSIESVVLDANTTIPNATIHVTVNATDNVGVTSVTADGVSLVQDGNNWTGGLNVPSTAALGTYSVAIQASDAEGNVAETTASYTVVTPQGGVGIDLIPTDTSVNAGSPVIIMVKVTNTENFDDTFNVELTYDNIPAEYSDYKLDFNWTDWPDHKQQVLVKAKSSVEIPLTITVPTDGSGYKLYSVTATSKNWITVGSNTGGILLT